MLPHDLRVYLSHRTEADDSTTQHGSGRRPHSTDRRRDGSLALQQADEPLHPGGESLDEVPHERRAREIQVDPIATFKAATRAAPRGRSGRCRPTSGRGRSRCFSSIGCRSAQASRRTRSHIAIPFVSVVVKKSSAGRTARRKACSSNDHALVEGGTGRDTKRDPALGLDQASGEARIPRSNA